MKQEKSSIRPSKTSKRVEGYLEKKLKDTYKGGKDFTVKHGMTGVIALLISTFVPMIEDWHNDEVNKDTLNKISQDASQQVKEAETRLIKQIDDNKKDEIEKEKLIWEYINKQIIK
jgi:hypothetical protein